MTNSQLRLCILGASDSGKSALANVLADRIFFESRMSLKTFHLTKKIKSCTVDYKEEGKLKKTRILVIDTPPIEKAYKSKDFKDHMRNGVHVFVICIKTNRETKAPNREMIKLLETFRFVRTDPVIIVFTHFKDSDNISKLIEDAPKEIKKLHSLFEDNSFCIDNDGRELDEERKQIMSKAICIARLKKIVYLSTSEKIGLICLVLALIGIYFTLIYVSIKEKPNVKYFSEFGIFFGI